MVKLPTLSLRLVREPGVAYESIRCPDDIVTYLQKTIGDRAEECFIVVLLDPKHCPVGQVEVSRGTLTASLVHPREVFKTAIVTNAHAILCAHNHPSGSLEPSGPDLDVTKQLIACGKLLGIPVLDHVIVTDTGSYSFRDRQGGLWFENS